MSRARWVILMLFLGTLVVYWPAAGYRFTLFDDTDYVSGNPPVQGGLTWAAVKWAFTTFHSSNWHPLTWISHELDCQLFGLNPGPHHAVNLLIHALNAVLLLLLLVRWLDSVWAGAFVAALFAWHPLHVESVAWISECKDVLSTFFALLALLAYTEFVQLSKVQSPRSKVFYGLALLCFALALMSKPMYVTLPFVMLLLDYWPLQRFNASTLQRLVVEKLPFFALVVASCAVTYVAQNQSGAVQSLQHVSLVERLENCPVAVVRYLGKIFWPVDLAVFYPREHFSLLVVLGACALLVLISVAAWMWRKPRPYLLIGWLWFLGTLVPVIGLVTVGGAAMADRYTYFPSIGIFLALACAGREIVLRYRVSRAAFGLAAAVLVSCLGLTHRQLGFWRDDIALFSHAAVVTRDNGLAHVDLGFALEQAGRKTEAIEHYREAIRLNWQEAEVHVNFANLLDSVGQRDEALREYQAALRLDPRHVAGHDNLGVFYAEAGQFDRAEEQYREAARLDPADWHAPFLMGKALLQQGRDPEALPFFQQAVRNNPNDPQLLLYIAHVLASDRDAKVRDGQAALLIAQKADQLTGGVQPAMVDALAMAYAEQGRFDDAQKAGKDAVDLANYFKMTNEVPAMEQRLELYKRNQPFRQSFIETPKEPSPAK